MAGRDLHLQGQMEVTVKVLSFLLGGVSMVISTLFKIPS